MGIWGRGAPHKEVSITASALEVAVGMKVTTCKLYLQV